jgi:hypothetical protein
MANKVTGCALHLCPAVLLRTIMSNWTMNHMPNFFVFKCFYVTAAHVMYFH